ncbi:glycoside hydrolase family 85 protein [Hygrophoropsis aurantiaca]|uniref:Glycoside hydrolase family 85 protein n=1 Tax=Hygrophoropsis aurantiaca TaxID=72124 RepID=A0ACB8ATS0_9AGAM|nr:glycoside hydrolase family 85 protein [Hygrophoropsis aurantiaca]
MPLRGNNHPKLVSDDAPFFESLEDLDAWATTPTRKLSGVLRYQPTTKSSDSRGKLLVCHDYKGGYTESPSGLCYTFNFWTYCDTFVYFSHHRVTVPPSGWTTAAHRQGVKMLGTLIFEGSGEADCLRLLVGLPSGPQSNMGPVKPTATLPLSRYYARLLAELAYQRGFDGYLLNFECPLQGGAEQARTLTAWIQVLRDELQIKVGSHAQAVWYDSVIINGMLRWQDRLNAFNLPFFLASDTFFTNYTWPPSYPQLTAQFFMSLDPALVTDARTTQNHSISKAKSLQNIFTGVDVWGRGSHGGGGFGSYRAISHIDPEFLGLSVALFGQAWTWESEQDKPGWNWDKWWEYERKLWIGPADPNEFVPVPDAPRRRGEPECPHGPFKPLASFFNGSPPPDPATLAFYTSFSLGVGYAWFIDGFKTLQTETGWTDISKQTSIGDLAWPRPTIAWEGESRAEPAPGSLSSLCMNDAWNGGNSLALTITSLGVDAEDAFFRCIWVPIQSLSITAQKSYEVNIVYKTTSDSNVELDLGLSVKMVSRSGERVELSSGQSVQSELGKEWSRQILQFTLPEQKDDTVVAAGIVIGFAVEDPSETCTFTILLGQLAVYPSAPPSNVSVGNPQILWAKFENTIPSATFAGVLTWDIASAFKPLSGRVLTSAEDPDPAWILDDSTELFPTFLYFNIYLASRFDGTIPAPATTSFLGTTGLDGRENRFYIDSQSMFKDISVGKQGFRLYVQGVTSRGEVIPWEKCAYVDCAQPGSTSSMV